MKKITVSEVNKKHLRIIGYLCLSWGIALVMVAVTKDERFVGLAPVLNYIIYAVQKELNNEGYREAVKK